MGNAQILIVEDESVITESLQELLKNRGYGIAGVVSSGEEAIRKALKTHPDLVLMDIDLEGDIDGVEAARQIHKSSDIPIVYLTAYADKDLLERAKITGPYGYVLKPFVAKDLQVVIEMALYKHKAERELKELNETLEHRIAERTAELEKANKELKREIMERRQIERSLTESEEKFRMISASAHDAIVMLNNNREISYWNTAAERIFAYPGDMVIGKRMLELIMPEKLREVYSNELKCFNAIGQSDFPGTTVELTAARRDGTEFPIELSLSSVKVNGKWKAVVIIRDISERREMEKEIREAHKMASIGRLTSGVFHEILNPLNIISSHVQLLLLDVDNGSMVEKDLNSIKEEIARIENIAKDLLVFSKEEEFITEEVEANSLLEEVTSLVEPDMKVKNIQFIKRFEEQLPKIAVNGDKLRRLFLNLIANAEDAMPEGGTVTISTQSRGIKGRPTVIIRITDTGCGIEKENIDKIFEPFYSTKKQVVGVGLGLSESYGIVRSHGGAIGVESEVGKGTTFTIDLPVERRKKVKERDFPGKNTLN